jgi:hypothetical protein
VVVKPGEDDALFGVRWIHVFEEDTPDGEVFRPETDDIPLSRRPRRRLELSADGTARLFVPGPDDRLVETPATWEDEAGELVLRSRGGDRRRAVVRIRDRSPTHLVVRK